MAEIENDSTWRTQPPYRNEREDFEVKYSGHCQCGRVKFETRADPVKAVYCHCKTCQRIHGAAMEWVGRFQKEDVRFTAGLELLEFYSAQQDVAGRRPPCKVSCRTCGTPIADEGRRMWLGYPGLFDFGENSGGGQYIPPAWQPSDHMFYAQRVVNLALRDDVNYWEGLDGTSKRITSNDEFSPRPAQAPH